MPIADLTDTPISELVSLAGQTAVVTGGARGIGRGIGRRFVEAGATVYVADLDEAAAKETADQLGGGAVGVHLDATDSAGCTELARRCVEETGTLDVWVNNAGIYPFDEMPMTDQEWSKVVAVNLDGVFFGARAAAEHMGDSGGVIINLSSTAGYGAESPGLAHYVSTKHAVRGLTKSLALEYGPRNIRSIALAPTLIETDGTLAQKDEIAAAQGVEDPHAMFAELMPLGRIGYPDDIARVALFCASGLAGFVNGDTILVDGGMKAR